MMIICKLMITTSFPAQLSHEQSAKISFTPLADFQHFTWLDLERWNRGVIYADISVSELLQT